MVSLAFKLVQSKVLQRGLIVLVSSCYFRQVFVHYLMSVLIICKQTGSYIFQVVSEDFPLLQLVQKNNRPEKFLFVATNDWFVLAVSWSVNYFSAPNSPLFWKSCDKEEKEEKRQLWGVMLFKPMRKVFYL